MAGFSIFSVTFTGVNSSSATQISVPGLKTGDRRIHLYDSRYPESDILNGSGQFGSVVTSDDELWQTSGNFSVGTYTGVFVRFS